MRAYDRHQAILRNPEYLKEWKASKMSPDKLSDKWGLRVSPWDPDNPMSLDGNIKFSTWDTMTVAERMCPIDKDYRCKRDELHKKYDEGLVTKKEFQKKSAEFLIENGRYLTLKLDLYASDSSLLKAVKMHIGMLKSRLDIPLPERERETSVNPWEVWDMIHKEGKNLSQATREIFDVEGNPKYDFDESLYKQVLRAYEKANKMIDAVHPTEKPHP